MTRRPTLPRPILAALAATALAIAYLGMAAAGQVGEPEGPRGVAAAAQTDERAGEATEPRRPAAPVTRSQRSGPDEDVFGVVDDLELHLPHPSPLTVAFHEATRPEALPIDPHGTLEANDNASRYIAPADAEGPAYRILSSRGRGRPPTSAVDVVVPDGARALSPVTGTVVGVKQYSLSGKLQDWRVVLESSGRMDLHVVVIHLHEPQVDVGDRVTAGETPLGVVRMLPFTSHVDYVVGERHPHVHLEVKPATADAPIDPNAPAVEPEDGDLP